MKLSKGFVIGVAVLVATVTFAACGGGGGSTPVTPTAIYGGAATAGDIFVVEMDYPATGKATITRYETDGTPVDTKEMTYTLSGNTYTFTDSEGHSFTGLLIPDTMLAMFLPDTDEKDIIISVIVDPAVTTVADLAFLKDHNYLFTQFQHDETGTMWGRNTIDADGVITGHIANADGAQVPPAVDLDDVTTNNNLPTGMDIDNMTYNADTNGFLMNVGGETWTYYPTKSGLGIIDKGPDMGTNFFNLQPTTSDLAGLVAVGDIYDTLFYGRQSETEEGTTQGTMTVTAVDTNSFTVTVNNGRDPEQTGVQVTADPSALWTGFYRVDNPATVGPDNAVIQLIGSVGFIFTGKSPVPSWQYEYGIAVKR